MTATTSTVKGTIAEWTIREQLILASAVQRSGDQNWVSVSRAVKPLVDDVRPADYFSQKNCALQYSAMLDKAGTPKRKRTSEGAPEVVETAEQQIVRQLTEKRINELNVSLQQTKEEYLALKKEIEEIEKGELEDKIPEMWEQMNSEIAAKEALEKKRESSSASVKLKSPPGKRKSPPLPSNLVKYHAQLKQRKMKSPPPPPIVMEQSPSTPQPVPMELCSPTSPTPILTPLKGEESAPPIALDRPRGEKTDNVQPLPFKSSRAGIVPPLKLPLSSGATASGKKDVPSGSPVSTTPTTSMTSPMAKSLPVVTTPKEETLGGVPMQAPHPSTEGNLQLSSNMHIIIQQPNTAVLDSGGGKKPVPEADRIQQPLLKQSEVHPPPSKTNKVQKSPGRANVGAVDNKMPSPIATAPSVSISSAAISTSSLLKTALASTLVTTIPALSSVPSPITGPHSVSTTAAITSPAKLEKLSVKQDTTPTTGPVHVAITKDATPTTNVTTPTSALSMLEQMNIPTTFPTIATMPTILATPTTAQITMPVTIAAAIPRAAEPVTSLQAPVATLPSNIVPTTGVPTTVQPSPPIATAGPPPTPATLHVTPPLPVAPSLCVAPPLPVAPSLRVAIESSVLPQPPPREVKLPPIAVQTITQQEVPSTLPVAVAESPIKTVNKIAAISQPSVEAVEPSSVVQPSSKPIESSLEDIQPSPMDIEVPPTKDIQPSSIVAPPSSTAAQTPPVEALPSTKTEVVQSSPKVAPPVTKAAPKLIQTTLKLAQGSPKIIQPAAKVTPTALKVSKMAESSSKATKPVQKADKAPETSPQVVGESLSVSQPSSAKTEPVSIPPVVTSTQPSTPPIISSSAPVPPPASKSKISTKLKPVATTVSLVGTPSPLLSMHTPTPSPLVTTAMKAPLVSSAVKIVEDKSVSEVPATKVDEDEVKPKTKQESKTVTKKRERERRRSTSEERTPIKSPSRKIKSSPDKMDIQEPSESRPGRKASTPKRSPTTSPSSTTTRTSGAATKSPKSPPAAKKGRDSDTASKTPPKEAAKEKGEEKRGEERATEQTTTSPTAKAKEKEPVEESTPDVSHPPQEKEKPAALMSVAADGPATPATPSGQKEAEQEEGGEMEETPVRAARTARKTPQRSRGSRKRKADDDGPSVESTDTEEEIPSSAQTSAVPSPSPSLTSETDIETIQARKQWKKAIMLVWRHAAQHKYANLFLHPVREEDAPGYRDVILRPMDLSTIKRKIESGQIRTDMEFQRDMLLMFQNAFMYNSSDHAVFFMAQSMKSDVMENIQAYLATQAQLQLMGEEPLPQKTLRSRESRRTAERDLYEESLFSPAKKRRLKGDD